MNGLTAVSLKPQLEPVPRWKRFYQWVSRRSRQAEPGPPERRVTLNTDAVLVIVEFLGVISIARLSMTCKTLHHLITQENARSIWTRALNNGFAEERVAPYSFPPACEMQTQDIVKLCTHPYRLEWSIQTRQTPLFSHVEIILMFPNETGGYQTSEEIGRKEASTDPVLVPGGRWIFAVSGTSSATNADLLCWDVRDLPSSGTSARLRPCSSIRFSKPVFRGFAVCMWSQASATDPNIVYSGVRYVQADRTVCMYEVFALEWPTWRDSPPTFKSCGVLEEPGRVTLRDIVQLDGDLLCICRKGRSPILWNWRKGVRTTVKLAPGLFTNPATFRANNSLWLHGPYLTAFNLEDGDGSLQATVHRLPDIMDTTVADNPLPLSYTRYARLGSYQCSFTRDRLHGAKPITTWVSGSLEAYYCIPCPPAGEYDIQDAILKLSASGVPSVMGFCRERTHKIFCRSTPSCLIGLRNYFTSHDETDEVSDKLFVDASLFNLDSTATYQARLQIALPSSSWGANHVSSPFCARSGRLLGAQNGVRFALLTLEV